MRRTWRRVRGVLLGTSVVLAARVHPGKLLERRSYPVVFIVGCPRSGTSWLHEMFLMHPGTVGGDESHAYRRIHNAASGAGAAPLRWSRFFYGYLRERDRANVGLHHYIGLGGLWHRARAAIGHGGSAEEVAHLLLTQVFDSFHATQGRSSATLVEKTPWHVTWGELILQDFPTAKIVEIVRDGRDVCASMANLPPDSDWAPRGILDQIRHWRQLVEAGDRLQLIDAAPERIRRVRYDELADSLPEVLAELFRFTGLSASPEIVDEICAESTVERFKASGRGHHVRTGRVGDWRAHLSPDDLETIEQEAGALLDRLGFGHHGVGDS